MGKKTLVLFIGMIALVLCITSAYAFHADEAARKGPAGETGFEKSKSDLLKDLESVDEGLRITKGCVAEARSEAELEKCRDQEKIRRYQEVLDKLGEIGRGGLSPQERMIKSLERQQ